MQPCLSTHNAMPHRTFGPNFLWDSSQKINTAGPAEVKNSGILIESSMEGFSTEFLKYHAHMEFRACLANAAAQDVYSQTFGIHFGSRIMMAQVQGRLKALA